MEDCPLVPEERPMVRKRYMHESTTKATVIKNASMNSLQQMKLTTLSVEISTCPKTIFVKSPGISISPTKRRAWETVNTVDKVD